MILCLLLTLLPVGLVSAQSPPPAGQLRDLQGHWAQGTLEQWLSNGLIRGYSDGTFRPNAGITRAEFVALVNRAFGLADEGQVAFTDVAAGDWFAGDVARAVAAGYIHGYDDATFRPNNGISRQEVAVIVARLLRLDVTAGAAAVAQFRDAADIAPWSRGAVGAAVRAGQINGYPDGTFQPSRTTTRAEAVVLLDRVLTVAVTPVPGPPEPPVPPVPPAPVPPPTTTGAVPHRVDKAGTYGPATGISTVSGDVTIAVPGVTLQNVVITGNLVVAESVGDGEAFLRHITVQGATFIRGGGANSIHLEDATLSTLLIERKDGRVRVVLGGQTLIEQTTVGSPAAVEAGTGTSLMQVTISATGEVTLGGAFHDVQVIAPVTLIAAGGQIDNLTVKDTGAGAQINLSDDTLVSTLTVNAASQIKGEGHIGTATITASGVKVEQTPNQVVLQTGSSAEVGGVIYTGGGSTAAQRVAVSVTNSSAAGFTLGLTPSVPGLTARGITVTDGSGHALSGLTLSTPDNGATYAVQAALTPGTAYSVSISLAEYAFGSPVAFTVPATPVQVTASAASSSGFTLLLSPAVSGLTENSLTVTDAVTAAPVSATLSTADGGASYTVAATLTPGRSYNVTIARPTYSFGAVSVSVPAIAVGVGVSGVLITGFTLTLNPAVAGLSDQNITLKDAQNHTVSITVGPSPDGGATYAITGTLTAGANYAVSLAKDEYDFGPALAVAVPATPPAIAVTAGNATTAGLTLHLNPAVPDLTAQDVTIADDANHTYVISTLTTTDGGATYNLVATLIGGKSYNVAIAKAGLAFGSGATFSVPATAIAVSASGGSATGFNLHLTPALPGLSAMAITVRDIQGNMVTAPIPASADGGANYAVQIPLTGGKAYTITLEKEGYTFGSPVSVFVPTQVVQVSAGAATTGGVTLSMSPASAGLESSLTLKDSQTGTTVAATVSTADAGATYSVQAALGAGRSYTAAFKKDGYNFGAAVGFAVPVQSVAAGVSGASITGFTLILNPPVSGLTATDITIRNAQGSTVPGASVSAFDIGATYAVQVPLAGSQTYTVQVTKPGYNFGAQLSLPVPAQAVAVSASGASTAGLTLHLSPAVPGLTGVSIADGLGAAYTATSVTTADGGASYTVTASLIAGQSYQITLSQSGYSFGNPVAISLPANGIAVTASNVSTTGFTMNLTPAMPGLTRQNLALADGQGGAVTVTAFSTADSGATYTVTAALVAGQSYTATLTKAGVAFGAPTAVAVPLPAVGATVSQVTSTGFTLHLTPAVPGLTAGDLTWSDGQSALPLGAVATADGGATYTVSATLAEGVSYRLTIARTGLNFGEPLPVALPAPQAVTATVSAAWVDGFTLKLSPAVPGLTAANVALTDQNGQPVALGSITTPNGGATYHVAAPLTMSAVYSATVTRAGYSFGAMPMSMQVATLSVRLTAFDLSPDSVRVGLDTPVPRLTLSNFKMQMWNGISLLPVTLTSAATRDGGYSYILKGSFVPGNYYNLTIQNPLTGYQFDTSGVRTVQVPSLTNVTTTIEQAGANGFTLEFSPPVPNLQPNQLTFLDGYSSAVPFSLTANDSDGLSYSVSTSLQLGMTYSLRLVRTGYWGFWTTVEPLAYVHPQVSSVSTDGFTLTLTPPLTGLGETNFLLQEGQGTPFFPVTATSTDGGSTYLIQQSLEPGHTYSVLLHWFGYGFDAPVSVAPQVVPVAVTLSGANQTGVTLGLTPPVPGLSNVTIKDASGNAVTVSAVSSQDGGATYNVGAALVGGRAYTITAAKPGFDFGAPVSASPPVQPVTVSASGAGNGGVLLTLTPAVPGLGSANFELKDAGGGAVAVSGATSGNGGASYSLQAAMVGGQVYTILPKVDGYDFGQPLTLAPPLQAVTASVSAVTLSGFALTLSPPVSGLQPQYLTVQLGQGAPTAVASATSTDGGQTYAVGATLTAGSTYSLRLTQPGYQLAAPVSLAVPTAVALSVSSPSPQGFTLGLSPAVPGLGTGAFTLKDSLGHSVAVSAVSTADDGDTYQIAAALTGGNSYTVSLAAPGYQSVAAAAVVISVVAVAKTVSNPSTTGFTLALSPAVPGLTGAALDLRDAQGQAVSGATLSSTDGGATYAVAAQLPGQQTYTINLTQPGYNFGPAASVAVPQGSVAVSLEATVAGFTLHLNPAVPGLTAANIGVQAPVSLGAVSSSDGGATYTVAAGLTAGSSYTITLTRAGYDFGAPVSRTVPPPKVITDVTPWGFTLRLSPPVPDLLKWEVIVLDQNVNLYTVRSVSSSDGGATYSVSVDLAQGAGYTVQVAHPWGYSFGAPAAIKVPRVATATLSNTSTAGFTLGLFPKVSGLAPTDLSLKTTAGDPVTVTAVSTSDGGGTYNVTAGLSLGQSYTLAISKPDNYFLGLPAPLPLLAQGVSASVSRASVAGFTLHLDPAVPGLTAEDLTLRDQATNQAVAGLSLATTDGGATYQVTGDLDIVHAYNLAISKAGHLFSPAPLPVYPALVQPVIGLFAIGAGGLSVDLNPAVPGLVAADFSLCQWGTQTCSVPTAVTTNNGGATYTVTTNLNPGLEYNLAISRYGYDFYPVNRFRVASTVETVTLSAVSGSGFTLALNPPVPDLTPGNILLRDHNYAPLTVQSVTSGDGGATYQVAVPLQPGWTHYLAISKIGYDFGGTYSPTFTQTVAKSISHVDATGFTIHLHPAYPGLTAADLNLTDHQGQPVLDWRRSLTTTDGGATYRAAIALRGGQSYDLQLPSRFGYDLGPPAAVVVPVLAVSATVSDASVNSFILHLTPAVPGLTTADITLKDAQGTTVAIDGLFTPDSGTSYQVKATLTGGATYTVQPATSGYDFGQGYSVAVPQPVSQTVAAWVEGMALNLNPPVPGLTAADFSLLDDHGQPVAIQGVSTSDGGASYIVVASLTLGSYYGLQLTKPGFTFGRQTLVVRDLFSRVEVTAATPAGFTLVMSPAVPGLGASDLTITDSFGNGAIVLAQAASSSDGGVTYNVTAGLNFGHWYGIDLSHQGYTFNPVSINLPVTAGDVTGPALTTTGFSFRLSPAVDGLTPADVVVTDTNGGTVAISALTTADHGASYTATAPLLPGGSYQFKVQPAGYSFWPWPALRPLPPTVAVSGASVDGFTVGFAPAMPGLTASNFSLTGPLGQTVALASATSPDGGASYRVTPVSTLPDGGAYSLNLSKQGFYLGPPLLVGVPYPVNFSVSNLHASGFTLQLSPPVPDLSAEDITLTDPQNATVTPYSLKTDDGGATWTAQAYLAGGVTYSLAVARPGLHFSAAVNAPVPLAVVPSVSGASAGGFTLALSPAVSGLAPTDLSLTVSGSQTVLPITAATTSDNGATYAVAAALTPGQSYDLTLAKTGYDFLRTARVALGLPPVLTGAVTAPSGTSLLLTFDKPMAAPPVAPAGFTVTVGSTVYSITGIAPGVSNTQLDLQLATAVPAGTILLSYTPGSVQAADGGWLGAIAPMVALHLGRPDDLALYLKGQGQTPAQIGQALQAQLGSSQAAIATALSVLHYPTGDLAAAVMAAYPGTTATEMATALKTAGVDATAVGGVLRTQYNSTDSEVTTLLRAVGFTLGDIALALSRDAASTPEQTALALSAANQSAPADQNALDIATALKVVHNSTEAAAAKALQATGATAAVTLVALKTVYGTGATAGAQVLQAAGYPAGSVAAALVAVFASDTAAVTKALTGAGYTAVQVAAGLPTAFPSLTLTDCIQALRLADHGAAAVAAVLTANGLTPANAYTLLTAAGYADSDALAILALGYGQVAVAQTLKAAGLNTQDIVAVLKSSFGLTAAQAAPTLKQAGYTMDEVALVLLGTFGLSATNAGTCLGSAFSADAATVVAALKQAGTGATDAFAYLQRQPGYSDVTRAGLPVLRAAGYDLADVTAAVRSFIPFYAGGAPALDVADRLASAGYTAEEATQGLLAVYGDDSDTIVYAVTRSYSADSAVAAFVSVLGANLPTVARWLYSGKLWGHSGQWPAWAAGDLLKNAFGADPMPVVAALRAAGYSLTDVGAVLKNTFGKTTLDGADTGIISALEAAGYSHADVLSYVQSAFNALAFVPKLKAAGYSAADLGAFMKSQGYSAGQVVSGLSVYPVTEVTLTIRSLFAVDAGTAMTLLTACSCYSTQQVTDAVTSAYQVDATQAMLTGMRSQGTTAPYAARTLKGTYGVTDVSTAVNYLKGAGYSQSEVLKGIYVAYLGEATWSVSTYPVLSQILVDVYGMTDPVTTQKTVLTAVGVMTPLAAIRTVRDWSFSLAEMVVLLQDGYQFGPLESIALLREVTLPGVTDAQVLDAVAAQNGQTRLGLLITWLQAEKAAGTGISTVTQRLKALGNLDWLGAAVQLKNLGYTQTEVISAVLAQYYQPERAVAVSRLLFQVYQITDPKQVLLSLKSQGYGVRELKAALNTLAPGLPAMTLADQAQMLKDAGVSTEDIFYGVLWSAQAKDTSVYPVMKQLGLTAGQAFDLLGLWGVAPDERIDRLNSVGYLPAEVFPHLDVTALGGAVRYYRAKGYTAKQVAYALSLNYGGTPSGIVEYLYNGGFDLDAIVFAMAPPRIAYDSDTVPVGEYQGVPVTKLACTIKDGWARFFRGTWPWWGAKDVALAIVHAKAHQNLGAQEQFPMKAQDVAAIMFACNQYGIKDVWDALRAIKGTPVWLNTARVLAPEDPANADADMVALRVLRELGLEAYDAGVLLKYNFYKKQAALNMMLGVGYGWWETELALTDVYLIESMSQLVDILNVAQNSQTKIRSTISGTFDYQGTSNALTPRIDWGTVTGH